MHLRVRPCFLRNPPWRGLLALAATVLCALQLGVKDLSAQEPGVLRGEVRSEGSESGLPGAVVELTNPSGNRSTTADAAGRYRLVNVPGGRSLVRIEYLGHAPLELEVMVSAGQVVELNV